MRISLPSCGRTLRTSTGMSADVGRDNWNVAVGKSLRFLRCGRFGLGNVGVKGLKDGVSNSIIFLRVERGWRKIKETTPYTSHVYKKIVLDSTTRATEIFPKNFFENMFKRHHRKRYMVGLIRITLSAIICGRLQCSNSSVHTNLFFNGGPGWWW